MSTNNIAPRYVTVPKAAEVFGISKQTIYKLHKQGAIRLMKAAHRTLVEVASVEEHLRSNQVVLRGVNPVKRRAQQSAD